MKTHKPQGDAPSDELLLKARRHYADISCALEQALAQLDQCDDKEKRAFSASVQTHWKSFLNVYEREVDLEKRDREHAGIVHGYAIDLDAARVEVGRRLACLRRVS
ncbi:MAG: hypothetical protein GXP05_09300 [Alphaproteobacteria bacterium]|nr:hypothetical protein [Alphaproteobacteria bacterium]